MSKASHDLSHLFSKYSVRKALERESHQKEAREERGRRQAAASVLRNTILPVLKEVSGTILVNGHSAHVKERLEISTCGLELSFCPDGTRAVSTLVFQRVAGTDELSLVSSVFGVVQERNFRSERTIAVAEVSRRFVIDAAHEFVALVLDSN